ncbi:hypothetical protein VKT23_015798 [Stygiomarasmius scandens]|uniref:NAD-dependent epimerase/dehydratase domain-containing protein n=1 Tax=Marasmiellus scandens TaxID=2682957 RepID=A0ABR1IZE0_9AGAR
MASTKTVVLTGVSGFIGGHIAQLLLEQGYRVRGLARPSRVTRLKAIFAKFGSSFEVVEVQDLCTDTFSEDLFHDVVGVLHVASPLPARESYDRMLQVAIEGSLNIIRQAHKAGIKKFVFTSSLGAAWHDSLGPIITGDDWNSITAEEAQSADVMTQYTAAETLSEKAVWEYSEQHPEIDVVTSMLLAVFPVFILNVCQYSLLSSMVRFLDGQVRPDSPDYAALSTNIYIYNLLTKHGVFPPHPRHVDVRDLALLHIRALETSFTGAHRKRLVIGAPDALDLEEVLHLIQKRWPKLAERLNESPLPDYDEEVTQIGFDYNSTKQITGFRRTDFRSASESVTDTVASLLALEHSWSLGGHDVSNIPAPWDSAN